ncbi:formyl transferase [Thalassotalea mangrovi]|uniref:Formyl transferase n=1 Tax=Thalassotalea mangrovi TaxID=2572245 RepID=A0A4V5NU71_9GAMM|nr:formyl transferase [Thalassotalea mangrovi]TKB43529.1 formyl transferase [Thalassotalea mangrovi]
MNITFLANRDLASNFALNLILPALSEHRLSVFLSDKVGKSPVTSPELQKLSALESQQALQLIDQHQCESMHPDTFLGFERMQQYTCQSISTLNDVNEVSGLEKLKASAPDLIISIRFGKILQPPAISIPELGVINLHSGLLPDYRGVMATFWALLDGQQAIGSSLHTIENGDIDRGRLLSSKAIAVEVDKSYLWHVLQLYLHTADQITDYVKQLCESKVRTGQQISEGGNYFSFPSERDLARFQKSGHCLYQKTELCYFLNHFYGLTVSEQDLELDGL